MKNLFEAGGLAALKSLSRSCSLYAFDFDGTLSKIVKNPADASVKESTKKLLAALSRQYSVAVISGRSVADLKAHLKFQPRFLLGNHGLENPGSDGRRLLQARKTCAAWHLRLRDALPRSLLASGVEIENKMYSLSLHYRKCASKTAVKRALHKAVAELAPPPRRVPGKCVINLLPAGAPGKGTALRELMRRQGFESALYVGDDATDEDVFALEDPRIVTIRVGEKTGSKARFYVKDQRSIDRLLKTLSGFYELKLNGSVCRSSPTLPSGSRARDRFPAEHRTAAAEKSGRSRL